MAWSKNRRQQVRSPSALLEGRNDNQNSKSKDDLYSLKTKTPPRHANARRDGVSAIPLLQGRKRRLQVHDDTVLPSLVRNDLLQRLVRDSREREQMAVHRKNRSLVHTNIRTQLLGGFDGILDRRSLRTGGGSHGISAGLR